MSKLLEDLYNGKIAPIENCHDNTEKCKVLREKYNEHYEDFIKKIDESLKRDFNNILDEHNDLISTLNKACLEGAFVDGFRLGAHIMVEVLEKG